MADAKRDGNYVPTLLAVSSADGTTPVALYADPTTHRLYVDLPGGTGTVISVAVTTANGVSGTVATATTTPAILCPINLGRGFRLFKSSHNPTKPITIAGPRTDVASQKLLQVNLFEINAI